MARGRPRTSDPDAALEEITKVFWERGYQGASLGDLTRATGMAKPGLYAAFGDKQGMFAKALTYYVCDLGSAGLKDLERTDLPIRAVLSKHFDIVIATAGRAGGPGGCFLVNALSDIGALPPDLADLARAFESRRRDAFRNRFRMAQRSGEIARDADPDVLAGFFAGQATAAAIMLRSGVQPAEVEKILEVALSVLPTQA